MRLPQSLLRSGTVDTVPVDVLQIAARYRAMVDEALASRVRFGDGCPERLAEAIRYSLLAPGKRLRPILVLMAAEACGGRCEAAMPAACAVEMVHAYSLIHDDLPAMDDDALRRGKPTNHVQYGEAMAILAGDALMAWAFEYPLSELPRLGIAPDCICEALRTLANALGPSGICGGQVLDTDDESSLLTDDHPWTVARQKTAVLIQASVLTGAIIAGADHNALHALSEYGEHLGVAFQMEDDILDVTSSPEELGKTPGKDEAQRKRTFVSVFGLEKARRLAKDESEKAVEALKGVSRDTSFLRLLAEKLVGRTK